MKQNSLWQRLGRGDQCARDALMVENLSLVHHVARQLSRSLAAVAEFDELVSAGTMGLVSAIGAFDASRGLAFSTFAVPRIRGAMLDELRRQDHVPRSIRRKSRDINAARESLMRTLGRAPDDGDIARALDIDVPTLWRWQGEIEAAVHVSLDRPASDNDDASGGHAEFLLPSDSEPDVEERMIRGEEAAILREAIMRLKEQERTVLALSYYEELKLHEIAQILELTESRVSQIRSKALSRLRIQLGHMRVA